MQGPYLRKYGVETTVDFVLFETDGVDFRTDAAHASGDTTIMKDEGAEANTSNGFTDEGQGYSIVLTATEMEAARIVVYVVDQGTKAWLDTALVVETYGNASAMHAFDLDDAEPDVNVAKISDDATAADNLELFIENAKGTDHKALISTDAQDLSGSLDVNTKTLTDSVITAAKIAADAFTSDEFATSGLNAIADALLGRDVSNVEDTAGTHSLAAVILSILEWALSGTTWTIKKTTGDTFTLKTVTTDADAEPVIGVT